MVLRHTAGSKQPDGSRVFATRILDSNRTICRDTHVLNDAIINKGQWLTILDREQKDESTKRARLNTVLLLRNRGSDRFMIDHVRLTADRKIFARTTPFH